MTQEMVVLLISKQNTGGRMAELVARPPKVLKVKGSNLNAD
jgi:hypothetical protein